MESSVRISKMISLHIVSVQHTPDGRKVSIQVDSGPKFGAWWMDYYPDSIHHKIRDSGWAEHRGGLLIRVCRGYIAKDKPAYSVKEDLLGHIKNMRIGALAKFNENIRRIMSAIGSMEWEPITMLDAIEPTTVFICSEETGARSVAIYDPDTNRISEVYHLNAECADTFPDQWSHFRRVEEALMLPPSEE